MYVRCDNALAVFSRDSDWRRDSEWLVSSLTGIRDESVRLLVRDDEDDDDEVPLNRLSKRDRRRGLVWEEEEDPRDNDLTRGISEFSGLSLAGTVVGVDDGVLMASNAV
jgi:hypothetical protein